jgi:hypothetical protein
MKVLLNLEVDFDITGFDDVRAGNNAACRHLVAFAVKATELGLLTPPEPLRINDHAFEVTVLDPTEKY